MKSFFWRSVICIVPCVLAAWVTIEAVTGYVAGRPGGFKLGTDLAGGTILVYEIDTRKKVDVNGAKSKSGDQEQTFDPEKNIDVLAEALKKRIDPNDLYNIIIRPAGGEGRIEIILPTGGSYRAKKAEESWKEVLEETARDFNLEKPVEVGRGKVLELADRIHQLLAEAVWEEKLFRDEGWTRLLDAAQDNWAELDARPRRLEDLKKKAEQTKDPQVLQSYKDKQQLAQEWAKLKPGQLQPLSEFLLERLQGTENALNSKQIAAWIKQEGWRELLIRVQQKWPELKDFQEDLKRIAPDSSEQLAGFIQARGNVLVQAGLGAVEALIGPAPLVGRTYTEKTKDGKEDSEPKQYVDYHEALKFIGDHYGKSLEEITNKITQNNETRAGRGKDASLEDVQRIKDLVQKVGYLEFRILANNSDDKEAIKIAAEQLNTKPPELKEYREKGLPPPGPRDPRTGEPLVFEITLARGAKSYVTYSWVELGPQERKALNLDNAAKNEYERNANWLEMKTKRDQAILLSEGRGDKKIFQGALFFSRPCEDRNLPEEERRKKDVEYFVLTRDPELLPNPKDPTKKTRSPKIDGAYLTNAMAGMDNALRPAVHFAFNNVGANLFGDITRKNVPSGTGPDELKRHLAIILDGLVMSAPTINSEIRNQGQISGSFTQKEVQSLVNILRAGRLPATLKPQPVSETTINASLGEDTIQAGVSAILYAFIAVLIFMMIYYRFAGLVASVALLANLLLTVGFMVFVQATFTLPGLAGLVLMLALAVDANVLIYERIREERERGMNIIMAIRQGYDRAFPTIIDTHLTSIFTAIVLYIVGNDQLKGFGVSLTAGLLISLFTSLFMTRLIFDFWQSKGWLTKLSMFKLLAKPDIDFMGVRKFMFGFTAVVSVLGVGLFIGRGANAVNIDFRGGTSYRGQLQAPLKVSELRHLLSEGRQKELLQDALPEGSVQEEEGSGGRVYVIQYKDGEKRTINIATVPLFNTPAERAEHVRERAQKLPDTSVELYYPGNQQFEGNRSTSFGIRTTEKEVELVQTSIDRLLRDEQNNPMLKRVYMFIEPFKGRETRLLFFDDKDKMSPALASPTFVKTLFQRELAKAFKESDKSKLPQYELIGEGAGAEGRHDEFRLRFERALSADEIAKVQTALRETEREFAARPPTDGLEVFDPQLATETRFRALWAVVASWGAILVYLWFRFGSWTFGLSAVLCLVHDLFFTLGAVAFCHYIHGTFIGDILGVEDFKLDLAAVAALLTLVGYSVNDTIVVFDRIREVRGKNPDLTPQMINDSVNQTLSRTLLTSFITWLTVMVLYIFGGPGVKLFAFVMVVGVLVGTYSSIYVASPLLLLFGEGEKAEERPGHRRSVPVPQGANA